MGVSAYAQSSPSFTVETIDYAKRNIIDVVPERIPAYSRIIHATHGAFDENDGGIAFSNDGRKVFLAERGRQTHKGIEEFTLSAAYDITTARSAGTVTLNNQVSSVTFSNDGFKMFVSFEEFSGMSKVEEYTLPEAFDLSNSQKRHTYDFGINRDRAPEFVFDIEFSADGHKMFVVGSSKRVFEYSLTTAFDLKTISYNARSEFLMGKSPLVGITLSPNGDKMFVTSAEDKLVHEYALSTPFDVTSAILFGSDDPFPFRSSTGTRGDSGAGPTGTEFSHDGMIMFTTFRDSVVELRLPAPFDLVAESFIAHEGSTITVTVSADTDDLVESGTSTINGEPAIFTNVGNNEYTFKSEVIDGGRDIMSGDGIPVSLNLESPGTGQAGTRITLIDTKLGIDANIPRITGMTRTDINTFVVMFSEDVVSDASSPTRLSRSFGSSRDLGTITTTLSPQNDQLIVTTTAFRNNDFTSQGNFQYFPTQGVFSDGNGNAVPDTRSIIPIVRIPPQLSIANVTGPTTMDLIFTRNIDFNPNVSPSDFTLSIPGGMGTDIARGKANNILTLTTNVGLSGFLGISYAQDPDNRFGGVDPDTFLESFSGHSVTNDNDVYPPVYRITGVSPSDTVVGVGSVITVTLSTDPIEIGLSPIAPIQIHGRGASFEDFQDGNYAFKITVNENDADLPNGDDLSVRFTMQDGDRNRGPTITSIPSSFNPPAIDTTPPVIAFDNIEVRSSGDAAIVGSVITVFIRVEPMTVGVPEAGTTSNTNIVNGKNAPFQQSSSDNDFNRFLEFRYTVAEGDDDHPQNTDLPVNFIINDRAGTPSNAVTIIPAARAPQIDANSPTLLRANVTAANEITAVFSEPVRHLLTFAAGFTVSYNDSGTIKTEALSGPSRVSGNTITLSRSNTDLMPSNTPITLSYSHTNILDIAGNELKNFSNQPVFYNDFLAPEYTVTEVTPSDRVLVVGDTLNVTITTDPLESDLEFVDSIPIQINGKAARHMHDGNGTYTLTIDIEEGDNDVTPGSLIPISFALQDTSNNIGDTLTTIPSSFNHPGIDSNTPRIVFQGLSASNSGFTPVGGEIEITIRLTSGGSASNTNAEIIDPTINGQPVTLKFPAEVVVDPGTVDFVFTYTVSEGDPDVPQSIDLPVNFAFRDSAGQLSNVIDHIDAGTAPRIETSVPTLVGANATSTNQIQAVFSEPVKQATGSDIGFIVRSNDSTATISNIEISGETVTINLEDNVLDSPDATITLRYDQSFGTIFDLPGNALRSFDETTVLYASDFFPPTFTANRTGLNTFVLTFSEPVTIFNKGGWTVPGAFSTSIPTALEVTTATLTTNGLRGSGQTTVTYSASSGQVVDRSGNEIANGLSVDATDSVAPIAFSLVDSHRPIIIRIQYFEFLTNTTIIDLDSFSLTGVSRYDPNIAPTIGSVSISNNLLELTIAGGATRPFDTAPRLIYESDGIITDQAGNAFSKF